MLYRFEFSMMRVTSEHVRKQLFHQIMLHTDTTIYNVHAQPTALKTVPM